MSQTFPQTRPLREYHRRSVVTDLFGRLRGLRSHAAAHKRELQAPADTEALILACREKGMVTRARALVRRFSNLLASPPPAYSSDLVLEAQAIDQMEDALEHEYHLTGDPGVRARWLRSRHAEAEAAERLTRALEAQTEVLRDIHAHRENVR